MKLVLVSFFTILSLAGCKNHKETNSQPNILWIVLEDTAPLMGCYGTTIIKTPNIDKLAKAGTL